LVAIALTAYFAFRTNWTILVSGADWRTVSQMENALEGSGIRYRDIQNGSGLEVDTRYVSEARTIIETTNAIPNDAHFTWGDALNTSLSTTDQERRQLLILGAQGQIESQLHTIRGISGAIVTLTVPNNRPFDRDPAPPTAAVILTVTDEFSSTQGRDIALLVARNVTRLELDNIMIIDQYARSIFNGVDDINNDRSSETHQMREQHRNQALIGVHQVMNPAFDEVAAFLNLRFDDRLMTEQIRTFYTIPVGMDDGGILRRETGERSAFEGTDSAMEPGLPNNAAALVGYNNPAGGAMSGSQNIWDRDYEMDSVVEVINTGPGWVIPGESSAAVTAVTYQNVYQDLWMAEDEERTERDWEIFKNANTAPIILNGTYEHYDHFRALAASAVGLPIDRVHLNVMQKIITHDTVNTPWPLPTILMVAVLFMLLAMLLYGLLRKSRIAGEDEEALEPQLAVEDLLVSTQLEEAKEEATLELEEIDYFKENEVKRHIEKFVNEKPEAVAALLRNWINVEEW
ncbi:MAG: hypothetical protein LBI27_09725, partial [Clostridiales bacterium]|jgi:flagellar M-ring protein FliF|nr:hypothetical protein [Clostridiales bacterium]